MKSSQNPYANVKLPLGQTLFLEIDPTGHHKDAEPRRLLDACGFLPGWAAELEEGQTFEEVFKIHYPYWAGYMSKDSTMNDAGVHSYPEDPDLYPLVSMTSPTEELFIYQYGIVGCRNRETKEYWFSRMD